MSSAQGVDQDVVMNTIMDCMGVTPGLVEPTLDPSVPQIERKPTLSAAGKKCFIDEKYFNQLFNPTKGVNEASCGELPFNIWTPGDWVYDSDTYYTRVNDGDGVSRYVPGGYFPWKTK